MQMVHDRRSRLKEEAEKVLYCKEEKRWSTGLCKEHAKRKAERNKDKNESSIEMFL